MAAPRVLLVEDDLALRDAMASALMSERYDVLARSDGSQLEADLRDFRPDLVILDVRLPGPDGFSLGRRLRAESDTLLVYVTAADGLDDRIVGFDVGADDYVTKPFSMSELLLRIRALLRRAGRLVSDKIQVADVVIDVGAHLVLRAGNEVVLTPTEFQLLVALARERGRPMSKERLLAAVWEFDSYDPNLVEVHVYGLRRKLEEYGDRCIHTVRGVGYVLRA